MKTLILKILNRISQATMSGNAVSSSRVQSFILIVPVLIMIFVSISLEIADFVFAKAHDKEYIISTEFIIIFGMVLSHHLALVFSRSQSQPISEISGNIQTTNKKAVVKKQTASTEITEQEITEEETPTEEN